MRPAPCQASKVAREALNRGVPAHAHRWVLPGPAKRDEAA
jgi:hypothetical protein